MYTAQKTANFAGFSDTDQAAIDGIMAQVNALNAEQRTKMLPAVIKKLERHITNEYAPAYVHNGNKVSKEAVAYVVHHMRETM